MTQERWVISSDGERFNADFYGTREEAVEDGRELWPDEVFFVGKAVDPQPPEDYFDCDDWLDSVSEQEDYGGDWADDWNESTKEQRAELDAEVRAVMAAWLDRHKLRPTFFVVRSIKSVGPADAEIKLAGGAEER